MCFQLAFFFISVGNRAERSLMCLRLVFKNALNLGYYKPVSNIVHFYLLICEILCRYRGCSFAGLVEGLIRKESTHAEVTSPTYVRLMIKSTWIKCFIRFKVPIINTQISVCKYIISYYTIVSRGPVGLSSKCTMLYDSILHNTALNFHFIYECMLVFNYFTSNWLSAIIFFSSLKTLVWRLVSNIWYILQSVRALLERDSSFRANFKSQCCIGILENRLYDWAGFHNH